MDQRAKLLIVDDEPPIRELLSEGLKLVGYECETADNYREALRKLESNNFHIILSDINMPGESGIDLLSAIKKINEDIDVIMVTGIIDSDMAVHSMRFGASDYITKPFNFEEVKIVIEKTLQKRNLIIENREYQYSLEKKVEERTGELLSKKKEVEKLCSEISLAFKQIQETYNMTLEALVSALDIRDSETQGHSKRVVEYCTLIAEEMNIEDQQLVDIRNGALLHDVGKIGIPDSILIKPGKLTEEEWIIMKKHPVFGFKILNGIQFLKGSLPLVLHHHERWDGSGYPDGLKKDSIPLSARIFSIADTLDAITSPRPYRKISTYSDAAREIQEKSSVQFDPDISDVFLSIPKRNWIDIKNKITAEIHSRPSADQFSLSKSFNLFAKSLGNPTQWK